MVRRLITGEEGFDASGAPIGVVGNGVLRFALGGHGAVVIAPEG